MSRGPNLNAQNAPSVATTEGLHTEIGGDRGSNLETPAVSNVPRTRTQAQVPGGATLIANGAEGRERNMPRVQIVR